MVIVAPAWQVTANCSQPLGLENGAILDSQLSASSSYQPGLVGPANARLNTERGGGAWCPKGFDRHKYEAISRWNSNFRIAS